MVEIDILDGVTVDMDSDKVKISGALGSNSRKFNDKFLHIKIGDGKIEINPNSEKKVSKKSNMVAIAFSKEIRSDIRGVLEYFEIRMEVVYSHFPMTMEVKGARFNIKNMLGEEFPRTAKIIGDTKIEIKDKEIRIYGTRYEDVSQTAANIKKTTKVKEKDERVFQDGIYYSLS